MKTNLKLLKDIFNTETQRTHEQSFSLIERWLVNFESELRKEIVEQDKVLAKVPKKLRSKKHSINIEEILGEES